MRNILFIPIMILIASGISYAAAVIGYDSFTGTDGTLLQDYSTNWSINPLGGIDDMKIISNAATSAAASPAACSNLWYKEVNSTNHYARINITYGFSYQGVDIAFNGTNFYEVYMRDNVRIRLSRYDGSLFNLLKTWDVSAMTPYKFLNVTFNITAAGLPNITVWYGGTFMGNYTDYAGAGTAIYSGNRTGIGRYRIDTTSPVIDDFETGNTTDASGGEPPASTCTPPATTTNDWLVTCSDNCNVTGTNTIVHSLNITGSSGYFNVIDGANLTINGNLYNNRCPINVQMIGGKASYIYVNNSYK